MRSVHHCVLHSDPLIKVALPSLHYDVPLSPLYFIGVLWGGPFVWKLGAYSIPHHTPVVLVSVCYPFRHTGLTSPHVWPLGIPFTLASGYLCAPSLMLCEGLNLRSVGAHPSCAVLLTVYTEAI